jgi:hypothetical protein
MATESLEDGEILGGGVKITRYYEEKLKNKFDGLVKRPNSVTPANAGVQKLLK